MYNKNKGKGYDNQQQKNKKFDYIVDDKNKFVNPYNFVSIKNQNVFEREDGAEKKTLLTGYMDCRLYTKTPIAILDTANVEKDGEHPVYTFIQITEDQYMIPASSIRGVIRNVYETATNSCFSTMRPDTFLTARVAPSMPGTPGILIKEGKEWELYEAERYRLWTSKIEWDNENGKCIRVNNKSKYNGEEVSFIKRGKNVEIVEKEKKANRGYLVLGEDFQKKKYESIFVKRERKVKDKKIIEKALDGMKGTLLLYRNSAINKKYDAQGNKGGYADFEKMESRGVIPIWYIESNENLYFMCAAIGRRAYKNTLNSLVGNRDACSDRTCLCDACRLFGMVGEESLGSRVRFTDARIDKNSVKKHEGQVLAELGSPRVSYMPFYAEGENITQKSGYDDPGVNIKGRKFYWHSANWKEINSNQPKTKRNATVDLLETKEGHAFIFKVFFDGITMDELRKLIWSIHLWENDENGELCHKIGHGKPIGLGSVKITVDGVWERKYDDQKNYIISSVDYGMDKSPFSVEDETTKQLLRILNFKTMSENKVEYPRIIIPKDVKDYKANDVANHKWFYVNKSGNAKQNGENERIQMPQCLSGILEEQQELYPYKIVHQENK